MADERQIALHERLACTGVIILQTGERGPLLALSFRDHGAVSPTAKTPRHTEDPRAGFVPDRSGVRSAASGARARRCAPRRIPARRARRPRETSPRCPGRALAR